MCLLTKTISFANAPAGMVNDPGNKFDTPQTQAEISKHNLAYETVCSETR